MSKKNPSRSQVLFALKEIEKEVFRVLGKQQENIMTITDTGIFQDYIGACINAGVIAIDTETNNSLDPLTCKLMGLCIYAPRLKAAYIPINHRDPETMVRLDAQLTEEDVKRGLQKVLESGIKIIMHNGKFDYEVLKCTCGICVKPHWDTMVATRLLNENERYGLKEQYTSKIDKSQEKYNIEKLFKNVQYADVKPEIFALYSAMDALMTYKLYEYQLPLMSSEKDIFKLFMDIEMPLVVIVAEMELCGALADLSYCQKLKDKYEAKLADIDTLLNDEILKLESIISSWKMSESGLERERVFPPESVVARINQDVLEKRYPLLDPVSGLRYKHGKTYASQLKDPINLSSPKQLATLLYKVLGAKVVNRRKPSGTGKHEIEAIKYEAEQTLEWLDIDPKTCGFEDDYITKLSAIIKICELLSQRRQVEKIITTYLNPVPALANHWSDGKVRFQLNQLGARTGRFTSGGVWKFYDNETPVTIQGMNAQNLPAENHEIRLMFKAEPGRIFVGGDISQQEPKITAHISLDENMLRVYEEGKDIYASIAQSIFKNNYEDNLEFFDPEKTKINLDGKKRRKVGKVIILATMYGMGKRSVARKLGITAMEAEEMLNAFYDQYEGVKQAIDFSIANCKKYGFVEDIVGRKRRLPNIQLPQYQTVFITEPSISNKSAERLIKAVLDGKETLSKEELAELRKQARENNIIIVSNEELIKKAERQSFNARIQGGAATLTKMIMVMVARDSLIKKLGGRIVFQIHDELILDCPVEHAETVKNRLKAIMENSSTAVGVVLPMKCDMTIESRWGEDTMTTELRVAHQELIAEGIENPLEKLCEEFCNFPRESVCQIIQKDNEILTFEW